MSVPGNLNSAPPPSSFDDNNEFYEESRWAKLKRKIFEEPLIPLGCALTVWALFEATKSIRKGNKEQTNRMFRRRIYAQGFTILAMVGGSAYWESDREKRRQFDGIVEERKKKEQHESWLKELEIREEEEQELRQMRSKLMQGRRSEKMKAAEAEKKLAAQQASQSAEGSGEGKSAEEAKAGSVFSAVKDIWPGKK